MFLCLCLSGDQRERVTGQGKEGATGDASRHEA